MIARTAILKRLAQGPATVVDIAEFSGLSTSYIGPLMSYLRNEQLIKQAPGRRDKFKVWMLGAGEHVQRRIRFSLGESDPEPEQSAYNTRAVVAKPHNPEQVVAHLASDELPPVPLDARQPIARWRFPGAEPPWGLIRLWVQVPAYQQPCVCGKASGHQGQCRGLSQQPPRRIARVVEPKDFE